MNEQQQGHGAAGADAARGRNAEPIERKRAAREPGLDIEQSHSQGIGRAAADLERRGRDANRRTSCSRAVGGFG